MGDLRPDNGGPWPPEEGGGPYPGLPGFPPEWGTIVIPDDASELDPEAEQVRRELIRDARRDHAGRLFGVPFPYTSATEAPSGLGVPLVIMAVAILTTLISLFVVTWDRRPDQAPPVTPVPGAVDTSAQEPDPDTPDKDLTFVDSTGVRVRLGDLLPAVVLLIDGCACTELVLEIAASAPADMRIVAVAPTAPNLAGAPSNVKSLADPTSVLRTRYAPGTKPATGAVTALLINRAGDMEHLVARAETVNDVIPLLSQLTR